MRLHRFPHTKGYTLIEMLIATTVGSICMLLVFFIIWGGTRLVTRNLSLNLAHMNVVSPMQRLTEDMHLALASPQLTGTLAVATGTIPSGFSGAGTKSWGQGKMASWSFNPAVVSGTGPAEGVQIYRIVTQQYTTATSGSYTATEAGYPVALGTYSASSSTVSLELVDSNDQALLLSATNGLHLVIPSVCPLVSGSNYAMLDRKITAVSIAGTPATSGSASTSTLVATCTLSGTLGLAFQTNGTRIYSTTAVVFAYLVAPVNYFMCGTDMIRLNYDGSWEVVMRNVVPTSSAWTQAKPFSMPWPYVTNFLSNADDGRRVVRIRLTASNPDYSTLSGASSDANNRFRGANSDMILYDVDVWSRMQLFDEMVR